MPGPQDYVEGVGIFGHVWCPSYPFGKEIPVGCRNKCGPYPGNLKIDTDPTHLPRFLSQRHYPPPPQSPFLPQILCSGCRCYTSKVRKSTSLNSWLRPMSSSRTPLQGHFLICDVLNRVARIPRSPYPLDSTVLKPARNWSIFTHMMK